MIKKTILALTMLMMFTSPLVNIQARGRGSGVAAGVAAGLFSGMIAGSIARDSGRRSDTEQIRHEQQQRDIETLRRDAERRERELEKDVARREKELEDKYLRQFKTQEVSTTMNMLFVALIILFLAVIGLGIFVLKKGKKF